MKVGGSQDSDNRSHDSWSGLHHLLWNAVLGWYRSCSMFDSDVDFEVSLTWWQKPGNSLALSSSLVAAGAQPMKIGPSFGLRLQPGYEQAWIIHGVKVDFFAMSKVNLLSVTPSPQNLSTKGQLGSMVGITLKTARYAPHTTFACVYPLASRMRASWGGLPISVPNPIEPTLVAAYGADWRTPRLGSNYRWDVDLFRSGFCTRQIVLCPSPGEQPNCHTGGDAA